MAFTTEPITSISDLITKLNTWMSSNGWTPEHIDITTTAGTGGEWAMRRTSGATNVRFAASWDAANSGTILSLYNYSDQNYVIADRPWGQDHDSGNGFAGTTPDSSLDNERHVIIGASPQRYWAYESDDYTHVVVRTADNTYQHFGWGMLDKLGGNWTGGEYCYGQRDNKTNFNSGGAIWDGISFLLDGLTNDTSDPGGETNGMELFAATIRGVGLPNQPVNGIWGVCMGGKRATSPQTDFGQDRQSNDGSSADVDRVNFTWGLRAGPFANGFYRMAGDDLSGHTAMWPICITYVDPSTGSLHGCPLARMKDVAGINMEDYSAEQEITLAGGTETWVIFPANRKWPGSGTGSSGYYGIAYKKVS